jgi:hypothetical protein
MPDVALRMVNGRRASMSIGDSSGGDRRAPMPVESMNVTC